jgi:hypothetical protein
VIDDISLGAEYVVTLCAGLQTVELHQFTDLLCGTNKLVASCSADIDRGSKVSTIVSAQGELKVAITTVTNDIIVLDKDLKVVKVIDKPHNG